MIKRIQIQLLKVIPSYMKVATRRVVRASPAGVIGRSVSDRFDGQCHVHAPPPPPTTKS